MHHFKVCLNKNFETIHIFYMNDFYLVYIMYVLSKICISYGYFEIQMKYIKNVLNLRIGIGIFAIMAFK